MRREGGEERERERRREEKEKERKREEKEKEKEEICLSMYRRNRKVKSLVRFIVYSLSVARESGKTETKPMRKTEKNET